MFFFFELTQRSEKVKVETSENLRLNLQVSILGGRCPLAWGCGLQGSLFRLLLIVVGVCSLILSHAGFVGFDNHNGWGAGGAVHYDDKSRI